MRIINWGEDAKKRVECFVYLCLVLWEESLVISNTSDGKLRVFKVYYRQLAHTDNLYIAEAEDSGTTKKTKSI